MASTPKIAALIVAAGRGTRAGGAVPKQWQPLCGKRVIDHTLAAFQRHPQVDRIIIVLSASDMAQADGFTTKAVLSQKGARIVQHRCVTVWRCWGMRIWC